MKSLWLLLIVFAVGCSPVTLEELRCQGEAETGKLAADLRKLETKEDLQKALPKIKKRFNRIGDILMEVRKFSNALPIEPTVASEELFIELSRLYELPGAQELIENAEEDAIRLLSKGP